MGMRRSGGRDRPTYVPASGVHRFSGVRRSWHDAPARSDGGEHGGVIGVPRPSSCETASAAVRPVSLVIVPGVLVAALGAAEARCSDSPQPGVNWTDCSKDRLMLDRRDLAGANMSKARLSSTTFAASRLSGAKLRGGGAFLRQIRRCRSVGQQFREGSRLSRDVHGRQLEQGASRLGRVQPGELRECQAGRGESRQVRDDPLRFQRRGSLGSGPVEGGAGSDRSDGSDGHRREFQLLQPRTRGPEGPRPRKASI